MDPSVVNDGSGVRCKSLQCKATLHVTRQQSDELVDVDRVVHVIPTLLTQRHETLWNDRMVSEMWYSTLGNRLLECAHVVVLLVALSEHCLHLRPRE